MGVISRGVLISLVIPTIAWTQNSSIPRDSALFARARVIRLRNGQNAVDLLGDSSKAAVLVAYRGNYNAHGFSTATFTVFGPESAGARPSWLLVPFFTEKEPTGHEFERTDEGADCTLSDIRLLRRGEHVPATVVVARRELGRSFAEAAKMRFDVYELVTNREGLAGRPQYYFEHKVTIRPTRAYCDVNLAFSRELGLGTHGLASSDRNP